MDKKITLLSPKEYYERVRLSPISSFDIILEDKKERFMLVRRKNPPAKNLLYWPGGVILKTETFLEALERVSKKSVGINISKKIFTFLGINDQIWPDNFKDDKFATHYQTITIHSIFVSDIDNEKISTDDGDEICWLTKEEILKKDDVPQYVKNYFLDKGKLSFAS